MAITPSVFVVETYMPEVLGGQGPKLISKNNPIWPPRLREIIKMARTPSVFVIDTSFWTIYLSFEGRGT